MASAVTIDGLTRAAEKYDRDFKVLPFAVFLDALRALRVRLTQVNYKDTIIEMTRKGGITKPYSTSLVNPDYEDDIMSLDERSLIVEPAYAAVKDNILNYREKQVLYDPTQDSVNDKTKKHPLEKQIIGSKIKTVGEDLIDSLFHAERDTTDKTPYGLFNGFDYHIDAAVASGALSAAKRNYVDSGSLAAPSNSTDETAINNLVDWLRSAHVRFDKNAILRVPWNIYRNCADALEIKLMYKANVNADVLVAYLRDKTQFTRLRLIAHEALGTGDRIHLSGDGNWDFGMNTPGSQQFVQVRNPYEDPNLVQYWLQFEAGTRINSLHPKKLMVNQGTATANQLSGDYLS